MTAASATTRRTCEQDGCAAPPNSRSARFCREHAYERRLATVREQNARRQTSILQPRKPTDAQLAAFLSNRDRPDTPEERDRARAELRTLERVRLDHLSTLGNKTVGNAHAPHPARRPVIRGRNG